MKNKGITLIALVITIIVLLILAGVTISMLSGENGILKKAAEAKTETENASEEEQVKLAALTALSATNNEVGTEEYYNKLNTELNNIKSGLGTVDSLPTRIDIGNNHYAISKNGVVQKVKWYYKKNDQGRNTIVTNGNIDLPIGTYVDYNAVLTEKTIDSEAGRPASTSSTDYIAKNQVLSQGNGYKKQTYSNNAETNGWRVLGVDEETGNILIITADPVKTTANADFLLRGIAGYNYAEQELNKVCSVFGNGYGAEKARSVNIEDINKITGYNPNNIGKYDPMKKSNGVKYGTKENYEYNNTITYSWSETAGKITWAGTNSKSGYKTDNAYTTYGFNWYDVKNKKWENSMQNIQSPSKITTLTSSYYWYYPDSLKESSGSGEGISTASEEYKTLFLDKSGAQAKYWLASTSMTTGNNGPSYYVHKVLNGYVKGDFLYSAYGYIPSATGCGVRAVVYLKKDVDLEKKSDESYKIL